MSLFTDILYTGLSSSLKDNPFAHALFSSVYGGAEIKTVADLCSFAKVNEIIKVQGYLSTVRNKMDVRARKILLKGIRRFPSESEKIRENENDKVYDNYFCLDFCHNNKARSSVFLGSNGVGKSSLYAALEKAYLKRLYSGRSRGIASIEEEIQYLKNIYSEQSDGVIVLDTTGSITQEITKISDNPDIGTISYPCFFCTEWDVESLAKENETNYIAEQLGISDFLSILTLCDQAINEYKEGENQTYLEKISYLDSLGKQLDKMDEDERNFSHARYNEIQKNYQEVESEIHKFENKFPSIVLDKDQIEGIIKTRNFLQGQYETILAKLKQHADIVLPRLFDAYKDNDILKISFEIEDGNRNPKIEVTALNPKTNKPIGTIDPRQYLNTFRFKLYCVALKISLAFCCKSLYQLNAPVVIDDVFDSSDFQNREKIKNFVFDLFMSHEELFGKEFPLQLIFFTQDDVVGDSVYQGIRNYCPQEGAKFSRIFNFMEVDSNKDIEKNKDKSKYIISYTGADNKPFDTEVISTNVEDIIQIYR